MPSQRSRLAVSAGLIVWYLVFQVEKNVSGWVFWRSALFFKWRFWLRLTTSSASFKKNEENKLFPTGCDFSDCVFWRLRLLFKKRDVLDSVKILLTTFSAFQKSKNCLLLIYHVLMWETSFIFFHFFENKSRRSLQALSEKQRIKSSKKNATWKKGFPVSHITTW